MRYRRSAARAVVVALVLVLVLLRALACHPFGATPGNDTVGNGTADAGDVTTTDARDDATRDDATSDASGVRVCPEGLGLDPEAPWPMLGGCTTHAGRTPYRGPAVAPGVVWSVRADAGFPDSANGWPVIGRDGTVYFGTESPFRGGVAIQPDGSVRWSAPIGNSSASPLVHAGGFVVFGAGNSTYEVVALKADATVVWRSPVADGDEINTAPTVANDGTVYIGTQAGTLLALDPLNGEPRWHLNLDDVPRPPALSTGGRLFVPVGGVLKRVAPNGLVEWTVPTANAQGPSVLGAGALYVASSDTPAGALFALDPADGGVRWRYDAGAGVTLSTPALAEDGTIYVGGGDGQLRAIDPGGTEKWRSPTVAHACTPIVDGAGTIFLAALTGSGVTLYAFAPSGKAIWSIPVDAGPASDCPAQPVIAADGTLYLLTTDGNLHAFR